MSKYTAHIPKANLICPDCRNEDETYTDTYQCTIDTEHFIISIQCNYCGKALGVFELFEQNPIIEQIKKREHTPTFGDWNQDPEWRNRK